MSAGRCTQPRERSPSSRDSGPSKMPLPIFRKPAAGVENDVARTMDEIRMESRASVRNAAAAFPAAKPLLRRAASSKQHEPASGEGFPIPTRPGARAGRPSKRGGLVREAGVVTERRGLRRTHARPGWLPSLRLLRTPGIYPWGGLDPLRAVLERAHDFVSRSTDRSATNRSWRCGAGSCASRFQSAPIRGTVSRRARISATGVPAVISVTTSSALCAIPLPVARIGPESLEPAAAFRYRTVAFTRHLARLPHQLR